MSAPELVAVLSKLLSSLPDVSEKRSENHVSFTISRKVFAFTRGGDGTGVVLKLPASRIARLLDRKEITLLTMGERTMKEWIVLDHKRPSDYEKDFGLFTEAMAFVEASSKTSNKKR